MKIYGISDQHGLLDTVVPPCDLLIVAGDNCPDVLGPRLARHDPLVQRLWFREKWLAWRRRQPATRCVLTWGNHDYCGELQLHRQRHIESFNSATHAVIDAAIEINGVRIWCSPWSKQFFDWAFMDSEAFLAEHVYRQIPEGIDVWVTHDPPRGYGDRHWEADMEAHAGSQVVLDTIRRVRPRAVVCGHIHTGYGRHELDDGTPIYNCALADGAMSRGTLRDVGRAPLEIVLAPR